MSLIKARAKVERTPTTITNDMFSGFKSSATWTRKARLGTKIYEQWP